MLKTTSDKQSVDCCEVTNRIGDLAPGILQTGIVPGSDGEIVSTAPLGFPMESKTRGNAHSLREEEARCIEIEL